MSVVAGDEKQFRDQILIMKCSLFDDDLNTLCRRKAGNVQEIRANSVARSLRKRLPGCVDRLVIFLGQGILWQIAENTPTVEILSKHWQRNKKQEFSRIVLDSHVTLATALKARSGASGPDAPVFTGLSFRRNLLA